MKCGIAQKTLDNQITGLRSVSLETAVGVLDAFPEISAEWFLRGQGQMLKPETAENQDAIVDAQSVSKLIDTIATLNATIRIQSETIAQLSERFKQTDKI